MVKRFGFGSGERLKSRKLIEELFLKGKSFAVFPIRAMYLLQPAGGAPVVQAGVTVTKKHFRKAVDRNRIKRLMREAYRLQKEALLEKARAKNVKVLVFFMYSDKSIRPFTDVTQAMQKCLVQLEQRVQQYEDVA
ncbi:MAG TPA: ribonuclease P protein component [Flavisolibacter sp.]